MHTEERNRITRIPLAFLIIKGFIHSFYKPIELYETHLTSMADDASQKYKSIHDENVSPIHKKIIRLEGLIPPDSNLQNAQSEIALRAGKAQLEIKALQAEISSFDNELENHIKSVNTGLEVLLTAYRSGYFHHGRRISLNKEV